MELPKPQKYTAKLSDKYYLTDNQKYLYLKFELVSPDRIEYFAGQYVSIKINEAGERRSYSIASTPDDNHGFHLLVEVVPGGKGSNYLNELNIGQEVEILAPLGQFTIKPVNNLTITPINHYTNKALNNKLLFIGTGSGVVPLYAMIKDLLINKKETRDIRLHWGMRSEEDLFFVNDLNQLSEEHTNFVFDIVLSKPSESWQLCIGHVQDCITRDFGTTQVNLAEWEAYICGRPELVQDMSEKLVTLGIDKEKIYHERYS